MERFKSLINKGAPYVLALYLLIGILAYVNIWPGSARFFYSSSASGIIFRAFTTALICVYSAFLFVFSRNKIRFPLKWLVAFVAVLLVNFVVMMLAKHKYSYFYTSSLYSRLHEVTSVTGYRTLLTMYLSSVSDFALGFCFLFILPFAFIEKKQLLVLTIPMLIFMIFECGYSIVTERMEYQGIFAGETEVWGGYNISIGATFGDKQEFGCFLNVGFCCALISFLCVEALKNKPARTVGRVICVGSAALFFVITFFTLCKTAILANCMALVCVLIAALVFAYRKNKVAFFASLGAVAVFVAVITLILTVDKFHATGFLAKFYKLVNSLFLSKVNHGIWSRFYLVADFFNGLDPLSFLFGFSKGGVNGYMRVATAEGQSGLHTGFVYFQACYGLIGSVLYFALLAIVLRNIIRLCKINYSLGLIVLAGFISSCVFNLSESEVLIISGSAAIFMFNVICVTFAKGYLENEKASA